MTRGPNRSKTTPLARLVYSHWPGDLRGLASSVHIHHTTLHRYLRGERSPDAATIKLIANALKVRPSKVLDAT